MTSGFTIQPEAADEANAAFNWYENQQPGLGDEFYRELTRGFELILENPLWPAEKKVKSFSVSGCLSSDRRGSVGGVGFSWKPKSGSLETSRGKINHL
jgi:hypothetical protein